ncbi:GIN domain-containing protein [Myroides odoratimimus]|uniref:GIN domain-containing protein n=1 Tax=Myroides odoratimimus TaxID=76832 RepID=UPI0031018ED6
MIRFLLTLVAVLLSFIMYGQGKQTVTIAGGVQSIEVSAPLTVNVDASKDSNTVEIIADYDSSADLVQVRQIGTKLVVDLKSMNNRIRNLGKVTVNISQKSILTYYASTVGRIVVSGRVSGDSAKIVADATGYVSANFSVNTISINVDSASKYVGNVTAKTMKANVDSAGRVEVTGDVESLVVNVDSAATFAGKGLKAKTVKAEVDSMGKAEVYPTESLNAYADSMGKVVYYNTPKELKKYTDSMGSVKAGN